MRDLTGVKDDFPILRREVYGKALVYLDSAATSQKPCSVLASEHEYYCRYNANVHRGVYLLAEEATELYESARASVAAFIGAESADEVIFTRNASEAINLVAYTWGRRNIQSGDVIALTPMEHHSNIVPWQLLAEEKGAHLRWIDLEPGGTLDLTSLDEVMSGGNVKLVAVTCVSNVLGTINPLPDIARIAHAGGAVVLADAAQAAPHMPLDVGTLGADFVAFTGHKMLGPTGIGVLWGRRDLLAEMPPFMGGGEMIRRVTERASTWNDLPWKFEAGTPNIAGAIGLGAAIDYLSDLGMDQVREHERTITEYALERLTAMPSVTVYGPLSADCRGGVIAFNVEDIHPHDLASILDREGVCVRAGHHCAQPLHARLGAGSTARASFYVYNDINDVDALCHAITAAEGIMQDPRAVPSSSGSFAPSTSVGPGA